MCTSNDGVQSGPPANAAATRRAEFRHGPPRARRSTGHTTPFRPDVGHSRWPLTLSCLSSSRWGGEDAVDLAMELTRFRGHLTLWGGSIHYAEIETAVHPSFDATEVIADHCESCSPWCSSIRRTARSRTSGEYLVDVFICPFLPKTQRVESPGFPGRFTFSVCRLFTTGAQMVEPELVARLGTRP